MIRLIKISNSIKTLINSGFKITIPNNEVIYKRGGTIISELNGQIKEIDEYYIDKTMKSFIFWQLKNGDFIEVNNMSTSHIENALKFIDNKLETPESNDDFSRGLRRHFIRFKTIFTRILRDRNIDMIINHNNLSDIGIDL